MQHGYSSPSSTQPIAEHINDRVYRAHRTLLKAEHYLKLKNFKDAAKAIDELAASLAEGDETIFAKLYSLRAEIALVHPELIVSLNDEQDAVISFGVKAARSIWNPDFSPDRDQVRLLIPVILLLARQLRYIRIERYESAHALSSKDLRKAINLLESFYKLDDEQHSDSRKARFQAYVAVNSRLSLDENLHHRANAVFVAMSRAFEPHERLEVLCQIYQWDKTDDPNKKFFDEQLECGIVFNLDIVFRMVENAATMSAEYSYSLLYALRALSDAQYDREKIAKWRRLYDGYVAEKKLLDPMQRRSRDLSVLICAYLYSQVCHYLGKLEEEHIQQLTRALPLFEKARYRHYVLRIARILERYSSKKSHKNRYLRIEQEQIKYFRGAFVKRLGISRKGRPNNDPGYDVCTHGAQITEILGGLGGERPKIAALLLLRPKMSVKDITKRTDCKRNNIYATEKLLLGKFRIAFPGHGTIDRDKVIALAAEHDIPLHNFL